MPNITNKDAYRFLQQQRELIEREFAFHYQKHGHDAETCILKAEHRKVSNNLNAVMEGKINE